MCSPGHAPIILSVDHFGWPVPISHAHLREGWGGRDLQHPLWSFRVALVLGPSFDVRCGMIELGLTDALAAVRSLNQRSQDSGLRRLNTFLISTPCHDVGHSVWALNLYAGVCGRVLPSSVFDLHLFKLD